MKFFGLTNKAYTRLQTMWAHRWVTNFSPDERQVVRKNFIKLLIGLILLQLSWSYLQAHEAEKASLLSGISVMIEKVTLITYKTLGMDSETLYEKHTLLRDMDELLYTASYTSTCVGARLINELSQNRSVLLDIDVQTLKPQLAAYYGYMRDIYKFIAIEACQSDQEPDIVLPSFS